jgi:hypothetical protein
LLNNITYHVLDQVFKWSSPLKHPYHRLNEVLKVVFSYSLEINDIKRFR